MTFYWELPDKLHLTTPGTRICFESRLTGSKLDPYSHATADYRFGTDVASCEDCKESLVWDVGGSKGTLLKRKVAGHPAVVRDSRRHALHSSFRGICNSSAERPRVLYGNFVPSVAIALLWILWESEAGHAPTLRCPARSPICSASGIHPLAWSSRQRSGGVVSYLGKSLKLKFGLVGSDMVDGWGLVLVSWVAARKLRMVSMSYAFALPDSRQMGIFL